MIINKFSNSLAVLTTVGAALLAATPASAGPATDVTLLSAGNYGFLIGNDDTVTMTNVTVSGGPIGIGTFNKSNSNSTSPDTISSITSNGFVEGDFGHSCSPGNAGSCTNSYIPLGTATVGTITQSPTTFAFSSGNPLQDALNAALTAKNEATTNFGYSGGSTNYSATALADISSGQSQTLSPTNQALDRLADNVFTITNIDLDGGGCLTINNDNDAGAKFVIDVTGNFTIGSGGCIKFSHPATTNASDVIFNIEGTGNTVSITGGGGSIFGTFLAPDRNVTVSNATITGEIIAGINNAGSKYTVNSTSSTINFQAYSPPGRVPEPGTLALFGSGTAAIAVFTRRRARRVL